MNIMLYHICKRMIPKKWVNIPNAKYKNYVMSDVLAQIEKDCERFCAVPRVPLQKVTIIGAGSDVGRVAALFLKQQRVVKRLTLYDDEPDKCVMGVATDLAHIDTSTEIQAYQGRVSLGHALKGIKRGDEKVVRLMISITPVYNNTDHTECARFCTALVTQRHMMDSNVVLICGGQFMTPPCCSSDRDLFFKNMERVRVASIAIARFCPYAVLAVQTPPVDCNFSLCMHTLKVAGVYDKRRVMGVNAISSMRANQLFCSLTGTDPTTTQTPVVCGTGRCTRVPVFSKSKAGNFPQSQVNCLTKLVREADEIICKVKSNDEQGHLSIGFSTARYVTSIMQGLFEKPCFIDSALVEQGDPRKCYDMSVCATPVTVGKGGIVEYAVPTLNEVETKLLEESKCDLEDMLNLGRCYAVGDEYYIHSCKICSCPCHPCEPCPSCQPMLKSKEKLKGNKCTKQA